MSSVCVEYFTLIRAWLIAPGTLFAPQITSDNFQNLNTGLHRDARTFGHAKGGSLLSEILLLLLFTKLLLNFLFQVGNGLEVLVDDHVCHRLVSQAAWAAAARFAVVLFLCHGILIIIIIIIIITIVIRCRDALAHRREEALLQSFPLLGWGT